MTDLIEFLRARLDEDAEAAHDAGPGEARSRWSREGINSVVNEWDLVIYGDGTPPSGSEADHIARWDPARVLAEVEAKRGIIELHHDGAVPDRDEAAQWDEPLPDSWCYECSPNPYGGMIDWPCTTVRLLASVYADHPEFDPAWAVADGSDNRLS